MGPGVLLVPVALVLCIVTSLLLIFHRNLEPGDKPVWIAAGIAALFAGVLVMGYAETSIYLAHQREIRSGRLYWSFLLQAIKGQGDLNCRRLLLLALGLDAWGGFLLLKAMVHDTAMSMLKAVGFVLNSTLCFAALGCGIGFLLGRFAPGYYRTLFSEGEVSQFDPIEMGIGLGLSQGAAGGAVIGLILVAILAWLETRKSQK